MEHLLYRFYYYDTQEAFRLNKCHLDAFGKPFAYNNHIMSGLLR